MQRDGESNFLTIVALVVAFIFVVALTAGFVFWRRHAGDPRVGMSATASTETATMTPTVPTTTATETAADTATAPPAPTEAMSALPKRLADFGANSDDAGGPVADTQRVLMRMRSGFRYCYNQGLAKDPNLEGKITLAIDVSPSGAVTNVTKKSGGINADVDDCLMRRARSAMFDASPSSQTVNVPLTFARAN